MRRVVQRLSGMAITLWLAATLAFLGLHILPGDALSAQLAMGGVSSTVIEERRAAIGLNDPLVIRYGRFLAGVLQGDLGYSLLSYEPVAVMIARDVPPTMGLAVNALIVATGLGLLLGIIGALHIRPVWSLMARTITSLSLSTPIYWTGTLAIYFFSVQLGLLPSAGAGRLSQLILPVAVLSFHTAGAIARVVEMNIREVMGAGFVRTARSKGLSERVVIFRHILRVALMPVVSVIALQAGFLFSGTVIVEMLFVRPGLGRLLLNATIQQDYPVVQGMVIFSALIYTLVNGFADFLYGLIDPRINA